MKRWIVYGSVLTVILGLGILLYQELEDTAQTQQQRKAFQQRTESMTEQTTNRYRRGSAAWDTLPDTVTSRLREIGFSPARLSNEELFDITLPALNGEKQSLSQFENHWILLNFWATWCPPCRFEMPSMNQLHNAFDDDQFHIIAVNLQESPDQVQPFVRNMELDFPIWLDRDGNVANRFYVTGVPETWLIAPGLREVGHFQGSRDWNDDLVIETVRDLIQSTGTSPRFEH